MKPMTLTDNSARPAIALADQGRSARLLRALLTWAGSGLWQVCPLEGETAPEGRFTVVSPGELSWELLDRWGAGGRVDAAVLDLDDPVSRYWQEAGLTPCLTYSENKDWADVVAKNLTVLPGGSLRFEVVAGDRIGRVLLAPGLCTLYQGLNIMACALAAGVPADRSAAFFRRLSERMEHRSTFPAG